MTLLLQKSKEYGKFADEAPAGDHMETGRRSLEGLGQREPDDRRSNATFTTRVLQDMDGSSFGTGQDLSQLDSSVHASMLSTSAETGVQNSRVLTVQRSTLTTGPSSLFNMARTWCVLALLPLALQPLWAFRCSPSGLVNSAELILMNLSWMVDRARAQVTRLAQQEITREGCAAIMDVLLVIYTLGFMVISMYQAMVIG